MNSITFEGRLGQSSKLGNAGETSVLNFTAASDVGFGDRKKTNWFNCAIWGKRGESLEQYLKKGTQVFVTGEFSIREYTSKEGEAKTSLEVNVDRITFINKRDENEQPVENTQAAGISQDPFKSEPKETESEMPF